MDLLALMPDVRAYLRQGALPGVPRWDPALPFVVTPLAQGEYNLNYLVRQGDRRWVLRVNIGSQIRRNDQIVYEYKALCLLKSTGVTPQPYDVDDSREVLAYGALAMSYLPGESLDYERDLDDVAHLFARIHSVDVPNDHSLIVETRPLSMTYEECSRLLPVYLESDLADPDLRDYLTDVLAWAEEARHGETYFIEDPCPPSSIPRSTRGTSSRTARNGGSTWSIGKTPLWGSLPGPITFLRPYDDPVEERVPNAERGEGTLHQRLPGRHRRPASSRYHRRASSAAGSLQLLERHLLVRDGVGSLPDGRPCCAQCRYLPQGHLISGPGLPERDV